MTDQTVQLEDTLGELAAALHRYRARAHRRSVRILAVAAVAATAGVALGATYGSLWGVPAPFRPVAKPFAVPKLSGSDLLTGRTITTGRLPRRPGFVIVWQSYCPPCKPDMTAMQAFVEAHPATPVIGIDVNDLPAPARAFLRQMRIDFPSIPAGNSLFGELHLVGYPTVFAFDRTRKIVAIAAGRTSAGILEGEIEHLAR